MRFLFLTEVRVLSVLKVVLLIYMLGPLCFVGAISKEEIEKRIGPLGSSSTPTSGTLKHIKNQKQQSIVCDNPEEKAQILACTRKKVAIIQEASNAEYAKKLYAELRRLDKEDIAMCLSFKRLLQIIWVLP